MSGTRRLCVTAGTSAPPPQQKAAPVPGGVGSDTYTRLPLGCQSPLVFGETADPQRKGRWFGRKVVRTYLGTERRRDALGDHWCRPLRSAPEGWCLRKASPPRILGKPGEPRATAVGTDAWPWAERRNVSPGEGAAHSVGTVPARTTPHAPRPSPSPDVPPVRLGGTGGGRCRDCLRELELRGQNSAPEPSRMPSGQPQGHTRRPRRHRA